jgi:DNA-binding transcriptional ArsR family regulator
MSNPFDSLERVFHEPARLHIMSELASSVSGLSFNELKERAGLTDGNLSRHLSILKEAGAVKVDKSFVANKPRTTVELTAAGRKSFVEYLAALEAVLKVAAERTAPAKRDVPVRVRPAKA